MISAYDPSEGLSGARTDDFGRFKLVANVFYGA